MTASVNRANGWVLRAGGPTGTYDYNGVLHHEHGCGDGGSLTLVRATDAEIAASTARCVNCQNALERQGIDVGGTAYPADLHASREERREAFLARRKARRREA